jgi:hypothetical protein
VSAASRTTIPLPAAATVVDTPYLAAQPATVGPDGSPFPVTFAPAPGATEVTVDPARLRILPALGPGSVSAQATHTWKNHPRRLVITVPDGPPVRSIRLDGLRLDPDTDDEVRLRTEQHLRSRNLRLVVAPERPDGTVDAPWFSVPAVGRYGAIPATLTGATFTNLVLTLPDPELTRIAITLSTKDRPDQFEPQENWTVGGVTVRRADVPRDPAIRGPDGAILWTFPGWFHGSAPPGAVDLTVPTRLALTAALAAGDPLTATFTLRAAVAGTVAVIRPAVRGALLRRENAVDLDLAFAARPLPLPGPLPPAETPAAAAADVSIRYLGVRLHPVSDPLPSRSATAGIVVTGPPVLRLLPPAALDGERVACLGVIGRAPEPCELSVRLVDATDGSPLSAPGTATIAAEPGPGLRVVWVDLAEHPPLHRPTAVAVTATRGRFLWAATGGDAATGPAPLVRLAVHDPDPGGRPVRIGSTSVPVDDALTDRPGLPLHGGSFQGRLPTITSDLRCRVELRDLVLRYDR